jgi:hypothetical protein
MYFMKWIASDLSDRIDAVRIIFIADIFSPATHKRD